MSYQGTYTFYNYTDNDIFPFNLKDVIIKLAIDEPQIVKLEANSTYDAHGDDTDSGAIRDRMKAKCDALGIPFGKTGLFVTVLFGPTEVPE